jgi:hypothetical protein
MMRGGVGVAVLRPIALKRGRWTTRAFYSYKADDIMSTPSSGRVERLGFA